MDLGTGEGTGQQQVSGFPRGTIPLALGQEESLCCAREYLRFWGTVNRGGQAPALGKFTVNRWTVIRYANTHRSLVVGDAMKWG